MQALFEPENPFLTDDPSTDPDAFKLVPPLVTLSDSEDENWARTPTRHSPHISTGDELFDSVANRAVDSKDQYHELIEACRKRNAGIPLDDPTLEPIVDEFQDILRGYMNESPEWKLDDGNKTVIIKAGDNYMLII